MATMSARIASGLSSGGSNQAVDPLQGNPTMEAYQQQVQQMQGFNPTGNPAIEALMQQRGLGQYAVMQPFNNSRARQAAKNRRNSGGASGIAGAVGSAVGNADPNNVSATGFNPNTGNTTPTYNNLNSLQNSSANTTVGNVATDAMAGVGGVAPQVQTGSFSPDASIAAEGIFGSEQSRGIQPYKKPLINF